jgi:glucokinase
MVLIHIMRNTRLPVPDSRTELEQQLMVIHQPLWDASAKLVEQESGLIIGLGEALGDKVKLTNEMYMLSEEDLRDMSELQRRFPIETTQLQSSRMKPD